MNNGVSVIITTVNRPFELKRAIQSVLNQNYENLELIVVVDGGSQDIISLLEQYSQIRVISKVPNVGGAQARNVGISAASKEWIALLDDDDEWLENKLETQISSLMRAKQKDGNIVSFTSLLTYANNQNYLFELPREKYSVGENVGNYLFKLKFGRWNGWIQTSTIVASRKTFLDYPFDPFLPKHQDWDWITNVYRQNIPIIHVDKALSIYHKSKKNKSVSQNPRWEFSLEWINN